MAVNDMVVRILGDSRSVERAFARSSKAANQFNASVETTGKRLDTNAKRVSGFAKGAAVGFGGAFAVTEGINVVKNLAAQAAESQQVLGQTQVALESTGKSWAQYSDQIQETVKAQSRLGFDDEALLRTFSQFQRTTGDVGKALRLNNLAMDVARARYIDLEQAANLVTKAAIGNAGALRRLGIDVDTNATRVELLTALTEKYGGAAEKAAGDSSTTFARTQVAVENLQESVGTLLLPTLEGLAKGLEAAAGFATSVTDALKVLGKVKIPTIKIPFSMQQIGGGTIGGGAGGILDFGDVFQKAAESLPYVGPILRFRNTVEEKLGEEADRQTPALAAGINRIFNDMVSKAVQAAGTFGITTLPSFTLPGGESKDTAATAAEIIAQATGDLEAVLASQIRRRDFAKRNLDVARATFKDQKKIDAAALAYARAQAAVIATQKQIAANDKVIADQAKASAKSAAETAAANEKAARERAKALKQAKQFRALGLSGTGEEIIPGIKNLQTRIAGALRRIGSGELDVSAKLTARLRLARKLIKKDGKNLTDDTRRVINDLINTVTQGQDKLDQVTGPITKTSTIQAGKILAGLGLSPELEKELRARLSNFNSAGRALTGAQTRTTGSFRGGIPVVQSNVTVEIDGEAVGRATRKTDQKNRRRNPVQKRGSRRGGV